MLLSFVDLGQKKVTKFRFPVSFFLNLYFRLPIFKEKKNYPIGQQIIKVLL